MQEYYDEFTGSLTEEEYQELAEKQMFEDRVNEYWQLNRQLAREGVIKNLEHIPEADI